MSDETELAPKVNEGITQKWHNPRLIALLFCDFADYTKDDKTNILGIFDRIYVHPNNKTTPQFTLFIRTAETLNDFTYIRIVNPLGLTVMDLHYGGPILGQVTPNLPANVQLRYTMQFLAEVEGVYWFEVLYKGEVLGGAGLVVEYRETEKEEGGTDTYV